MVVLYRKYRPQTLGELFGQDALKESLSNAFLSGKISHAYLFFGPRGTGKTTTARIIAKTINCEKNYAEKKEITEGQKYSQPCNKCETCRAITVGSYLDVIEIDAASNRGIDDIRDLREKIKLAPTEGKYKVYIIDEVHMLTTEAFNALLKTLEEPPVHSIFVLCTTEPKKVPETIVSRCQKFEFKKAKNSELFKYLQKIAQEEKIDIDDEALKELLPYAQGGFRDAVSLLDQIGSGTSGVITKEFILSNLNLATENLILDFFDILKTKNTAKAMFFLKEYFESGKDIIFLVKEVIFILEKELYIIFHINEEIRKTDFTVNELRELLDRLIRCETEIKFAFLPQIPLELLVLDWCGVKEAEESGGRAVGQIEKTEAEKEKVIEKNAVPVGFDQFIDDWPVFLAALKPFNHSLEMLLKKCEPAGIDGDQAEINVFYKLHRDVLMNPKNLKIINQCLIEVYKQPLLLKFTLSEPKKKTNLSGDDLAAVAEEMFK